MRSPDNDSRISAKPAFAAMESKEIPDHEDYPKGLVGVKAPYGYKQTGEIADRLQAAGNLRDVIPFVMK